MNCNEFKNQLADLFDQEISAKTWAEMKEHMATCPDCRAEYEALKEVADDLLPKHSPVQEKQIEKTPVEAPQIALRPRRRWMNIAASVALFAVGLVLGSTHFFSESAQAAASPFSFEQAIQSVRNVGSYLLQLQVRTLPDENYAHFDPHAEFMDVTMQKQTLNNHDYWRVEKKEGRTIVCDSREQYMWVPGKMYLKGGPQANFLENFTLFLEPTRLLNMQQMALQLHKDIQSTTQVTDSTITVTTSFEVDGTELSAIFNNTSSTKVVTIQNTCSMPDGLLRSLHVWIDWHGEKVEIIRSRDIQYNVAIDRDSLLQLPAEADWLDLTQGIAPLKDDMRLALLSQETPVNAAQRILQALISGQTDEATEALHYYKDVLPTLVKMFEGCKVSDFTVRREKSYAGVFVFYTLTHPDGKTETCHVALRNDNQQHLWLLDGGI